jgi:hypothetical protein
MGVSARGSWRDIGLVSPDLAHGIRHQAFVRLFEGGARELGVVTNVDQLNYDGHSIYAFGRKEDFPVWYDMLRNEAPVRFRYEYEGEENDPNRPVRRLRNIVLFTGLPEPPGEGPEEVAANLFPEEVLAVLRNSTPAAEG